MALLLYFVETFACLRFLAPRMWPFFLARKQLFPPGRFPVFAFVSILGVALGVTALLVVQTVMNSFGEEHQRRVREANGDVLVFSENGKAFPVTGEESFLTGLKNFPGVKAAAPYAEDGIVVLGNGKFDLNMLRGIDPEREDDVVPVKKYLAGGNWEDFDDEHVVLGWLAARKLGVTIGDTVTLQTPHKLQAAFEGAARITQPRDFVVCGILETGFRLADERALFVTLRAARDLFDIPDGTAPRVHIKLHDHHKSAAFAERLSQAPFVQKTATELRPDFLYVRPWHTVNRAFLDSVDMEKAMLFYLMFIITLVASFSIGSTLFSHVVRRAREIGLLGALGAKPAQILSVFVTQGLLIGVAGYALGVVLAMLILWQRQAIVGIIGAGAHISVEMFSKVPLYYNTDDFVKAALLTIILITVVSLLPAFWAARRKPSEVMRDVT